MDLSTLSALANFASPWPRRPSYLLLFVTSRCRAACGHCFYWRRTNRAERELTLDEIDALARSLGGMLQITITGGSPELRDDLADVVVTLARRCRPVNMTLSCNGCAPQRLRDAVERVLTDCPRLNLTVDISVDGLFDEHDALRRLPGLFSDVRRSYAALASLRASHLRLRLGMGLCVSGLNQHTAERTACWATDNLPIDNLTPILVRGEPRRPAALDCDPAVFLRIAETVERRLQSKAFRGYAAFPRIVNAKDIVQKRLIAQIAKVRRPLVRCSALRETAVVYPDGSVPRCELHDERVGNLRDVGMDLRHIWTSQAAVLLRKRIVQEKCYCWHQCFLSAPIMKSPRMWPHLFGAMYALGRSHSCG